MEVGFGFLGLECGGSIIRVIIFFDEEQQFIYEQDLQ